MLCIATNPNYAKQQPKLDKIADFIEVASNTKLTNLGPFDRREKIVVAEEGIESYQAYGQGRGKIWEIHGTSVGISATFVTVRNEN